MALVERKTSSVVSKVMGPIRCHTCRLICRDADHYLNHECAPKHRLTTGRRIPQLWELQDGFED